MRPFSNPRTSAATSPLLAACVCVLLLLLVLSGCSRRESVTVQIDISKSLDISYKARSPANGPAVTLSPFTVAAAFGGPMKRETDSEDFRALPISKRFAKDDNADQVRLFHALSDMCSYSVRADPPAVRVTVTASDQKEAATIANLIGKSMREMATTGAATDLANRREVENQTLSLLEQHAGVLRDLLDQLARDIEAAPSDASQTTERRASDVAELWASHELHARELRRVRSETQVARTSIHTFEDLASAVHNSATFWIVPSSAPADTGWTQLPKLDRDVVGFAVHTLSGRDWLTASLSPDSQPLAAAVVEPEVSTTTWMKSFSRPMKTAQASGSASPDHAAAISDLSHRTSLSSIGDGSVFSLTLAGTLSADDRYSILNALTRRILSKKRADDSMDSVTRREPIGRRISAFDFEFRELERAFQSLAKRTGATRDTIGSLYESSQEGRDIERVASSRDALDRERKYIELHCHPIFDDVYIIRNALPPE